MTRHHDRHGARLALGIPLLLLLSMVGVAAAPAASGCDRACRIAAGNAYLASLVSHDASQVPLTPDAQRYENGSNTGDGAEAIRAANSSPIMFVITGIQDLHWEVDGDRAVARYYLDTVAPTYIIERFTVTDEGLISEIRANFHIDADGALTGPESPIGRPNRQVTRFTAYNHGPLGPAPVDDGDAGDDEPRPASSCGRDCVEAAVGSFLSAMRSHDPSEVPLAPGVTQHINHRFVGDVAGNLAASAAITDVTNVEVLVEGERAVALYDIVTEAGTLPGGARFQVVDGAITDIDAVCDGAEMCGSPASSGSPMVGANFVATPQATAAGFASRVVVMTAGTDGSFFNGDTVGHDVVGTSVDADGNLLFASAYAPGGAVVPVDGVARLAPGTYNFVCSLHPSMQGTLVVQ